MAEFAYSRLTDLIDLMVEMQGRWEGVSISDVQERYHVSRRTAERMLEAVKLACPQIEEIESSSKKKYWGFTDYSINNLVCFSPAEVAFLENLKKKGNNFSADELENIITKIKALNSNKKYSLEKEVEFLLKSEGMAMSQQPHYNVDLGTISVIRQGIKNSSKLRGKYNGKQKLLSPLGIVYGEKVYLVAREEDKGMGEYCYQLHKLEDLKVSLERFDPRGFDIKEYTEKSFGVYQGEIYSVKLKFSENVREDALNYNFHPTQKVKANDDGTVTVTFKASGDMHILWHLFKWGEDVEILSPKSLKKEYIKILENCLENQKQK